MTKKRTVEDDANEASVKEPLSEGDETTGSRSGGTTASPESVEDLDDTFGEDCGVYGEAEQDVPPGYEEKIRNGKVILTTLANAITDEDIRVALHADPRVINNEVRAGIRFHRVIEKHVRDYRYISEDERAKRTAEAQPGGVNSSDQEGEHWRWEVCTNGTHELDDEGNHVPVTPEKLQLRAKCLCTVCRYGHNETADEDEPVRTRGYYDKKYPDSAVTLRRKKRRLERVAKTVAEEQVKHQEEQKRQIKADGARVKRSMEKKYVKGHRLG